MSNSKQQHSSPSRGQLAFFVLASGSCVAVVTAMANVFWLASVLGVGRMRTTIVIHDLIELLPGITGILNSSFPSLLARPYDLTSVRPFLFFMVLVIAANLIVAWVVGVALSSVGLIRKRGSDFRLWHTGLFRGAVVVLFSLPATAVFVDEIMKGYVRGHTALIVTLVALVCWFAVSFLFRSSARARIFQWASGLTTVFLVVLVVLAAIGASWNRPRPSNSANTANGRLNILLVSIDSLRADHLGCYGYKRPTSPVIDSLAREGVRFQTVVAPTSWTLPSHLTLLTGVPPSGHGVTNDRLQLPTTVTSLSTVLWQFGYTTAGFVSGPYLSADYGFARGFDTYDDYTVAATSHESSHHGITSPGLLRLVGTWLSDWDDAGRKRPFFLFLHMWDVHYDYNPPPPYNKMFGQNYSGSITGENYERSNEVHPGLAQRDLDHIIALYDGEISFTDYYLGKVVDRLQQLGVLDHTLLVVTADHGEEFFEHGNKGHRKALYDESLLVPLIIRYPASVPAGTVVTDQVRLMDIAPTILSLAAVPERGRFGSLGKGPAFAARDLTPLLVAGSPPNRLEMAAVSRLHDEQIALRTAGAKLIHRLEKEQSYELYDLAADPGEKHNLLFEKPALAAELDKQLVEWTRAWGGHLKAREFELSEDQKKKLRSLGYIQ